MDGSSGALAKSPASSLSSRAASALILAASERTHPGLRHAPTAALGSATAYLAIIGSARSKRQAGEEGADLKIRSYRPAQSGHAENRKQSRRPWRPREPLAAAPVEDRAPAAIRQRPSTIRPPLVRSADAGRGSAGAERNIRLRPEAVHPRAQLYDLEIDARAGPLSCLVKAWHIRFQGSRIQCGPATEPQRQLRCAPVR